MAESRPRSRVATEQALIDAARQLISVRPFEAIRTRDVADVVGCNHGLITQYFGTKTALFTKVLHNVAQEIGVATSSGMTIPEIIRMPVMSVYWKLLASLLGAGMDPKEALQSDSPVVEAIAQRSMAITGQTIEAGREFAAHVILMLGGYHVFGDAFMSSLAPDGNRENAERKLQQSALYILEGLTRQK